MWLSTAQPTTRRENRSMTRATYSQPSNVHTYVMSVVQTVLGAATSNCLSKRLGETASLWLLSVVALKRLG